MWGWLGDTAARAAVGASSITDLILIGGGLFLGWKLIDLWKVSPTVPRNMSRRTSDNKVRVKGGATPSLRRHLDDTELVTWFERDRARIEPATRPPARRSWSGGMS